MSEEIKKQYFYLSIGYIGYCLIIISLLRYLLVTDELGGIYVAIVGFICFGSFLRYVESEFLAQTKVHKILKTIFLGVIFIIWLAGSFLIFK